MLGRRHCARHAVSSTSSTTVLSRVHALRNAPAPTEPCIKGRFAYVASHTRVAALRGVSVTEYSNEGIPPIARAASKPTAATDGASNVTEHIGAPNSFAYTFETLTRSGVSGRRAFDLIRWAELPTAVEQVTKEVEALCGTKPTEYGWWSTPITRHIAGGIFRNNTRHGDLTGLHDLATSVGISLPRAMQRSVADWLCQVPQPAIDLWRGENPGNGRLLDAIATWLNRPWKSLLPLVARSLAKSTSFEHDVLPALECTLDARERLIIHERYGLHGRSQCTLDEIGIGIGVTRERIRQIQKKTLLRLASRLHELMISAYLHTSANDIWRCRAPTGTAGLDVTASNLVGIDSLLLDICYHNKPGKSLTHWLDMHAQMMRGRWVRGRIDTDALAERLRSAREYLESIPLPRPIAWTREPYSDSLSWHSTALGDLLHREHDISLVDGYWIRGSLRARLRRTLRLHALLLRSTTHLTQISTLTIRYNREFPEEKCRMRDVAMQLSAHPHLFIQGDLGWWAALDDHTSQHSDETVIPRSFHLEEASKEELEQIISTDPVATVIRSAIEAHGGVATLGSLVAELAKEDPPAVKRGSLFALLHSRGQFTRMAPGVYGLLSNSTALNDNTTFLNLLLSSRAIRHFVQARYAGEPHEYYPLWTPAMEFKWCKWASDNVPTEVFESLCAVATPKLWPCSQRARESWQRRLSTDSPRYLLCADRRGLLTERVPLLERLFALVSEQDRRASLSWIHTNRVTRNRIDSHGAASYLAILVAVGVLVPAEHWQMTHEFTNASGGIRHELNKELRSSGSLTWSSATGSALLADIKNGSENRHIGWVPVHELEQLVGLLMGSLQVTKTNTETHWVDVDTTFDVDDEIDAAIQGEIEHELANQLELDSWLDA